MYYKTYCISLPELKFTIQTKFTDCFSSPNRINFQKIKYSRQVTVHFAYCGANKLSNIAILSPWEWVTCEIYFIRIPMYKVCDLD